MDQQNPTIESVYDALIDSINLAVASPNPNKEQQAIDVLELCTVAAAIYIQLQLDEHMVPVERERILM